MRSVVAKATPKILLSDLRHLIAEVRQDIARQMNPVLVLLYWRVGQPIRRDILREKRAEYGEQIVAAAGRQLEMEFGRGFGEKNLRRWSSLPICFRTRRLSQHCCDNWGGLTLPCFCR